MEHAEITYERGRNLGVLAPYCRGLFIYFRCCYCCCSSYSSLLPSQQYCSLAIMSTMLLVLLSAAVTPPLDTIVIYTKPAPPMSMYLEDHVMVGGYSIQFWKDFVAPKLGVTDVQTVMLLDNNEIMSSNGLLSATCSPSNVLCVGAAAISITESREVYFDFFSSYYTNNVRILTTITPDPADVLYVIILAVWQLAVGIILFFWFFNMSMVPLVWAFEMLTVPSNKLPIFMPSDKEVTRFGGESLWLRGQYIVAKSFKNALVWTVSTFLGTKLARPQSKVGRNVLLPLTRLSTSLVGVIATAACAAIFTIDAGQAASISGVSDLGKNHKVCYNLASTFNTNLVRGKSSENGFLLEGYNGLSATLDAYYDKQCDAVIYDDVILQGDLIDRRASVAPSDRTYGRVQKSGVVGDSMKWDPYGFLTTSGHVHYEVVNRAVVSVATDDAARETLEAAYLQLALQPKTGIDLATFGSQWVWMPSAIGGGLIFLAIVGVYINVLLTAYGCTKSAARTSRASLGHTQAVRGEMLKAKLERGMADIALQPSHELVHDMAFEMQDLQTDMQRALEMLRCLSDGAGNGQGQGRPKASDRVGGADGTTSHVDLQSV